MNHLIFFSEYSYGKFCTKKCSHKNGKTSLLVNYSYYLLKNANISTLPRILSFMNFFCSSTSITFIINF